MAMHWVLVGDAGGVKVYESDALLEDLALVTELSATHLPGAGPTAAQAEHDPHKMSEERFARAVAQAVDEAEGHHRFERLIVVLPPRFLGEFRSALSHNALKRVVATVHHDWTRLSRRDLSHQLRKSLPEAAGLP